MCVRTIAMIRIILSIEIIQNKVKLVGLLKLLYLAFRARKKII